MNPSFSLAASVTTVLIGAFAYGTVSRAWEQAEPEIQSSTPTDEEQEFEAAMRLSLQQEGGEAPTDT